MQVEHYEYHELSNIFPFMGDDEFNALVEDIRINGLREPIWLYENKIIDGRNRYKACQALGIEPKYREWHRDGSLIDFVVSLNLHRRHLTSSQKAVLALELEPWYASEAKQRQVEAAVETNAKLGRAETLTQIVEQPLELDRNKRTATEQAAKATGTNRQYVSDAKKLRQESPELVERIRTGELTIPEAKKQVKAEKRREQIEELRAAISEIPAQEFKGPFSVIVSDPPWQYDSRAEDITHRAANPYPTMPTGEICGMDIPAADDCILWLWTTNAFMHDALHVADAWGFTVKTILTWVKDRMGTGDWLRGQTEHCLMCVKGKPIVDLTNQTTVLHGPMREHSRKPDEFYTLVEALCPGTKLEMFARTEREGWASFGNDTNKF